MDTIVAIATPQGRSGIGVVRLSGPAALPIALAITNSNRLEPRVASLRHISDPANAETIDDAVVTYFQAPRSFTGEDVVEISCHGSPVVVRAVIDACLRLDARLAGPGEFSLRAVANGRMDLAEAEAVRDLIDAQTGASARQAIRQMRGELSNLITPLKDRLLDVIVILESSLEFVEDDLPETHHDAVRQKLLILANDLDRLADTYRVGHLIRDGIKVVLAGRPNVGKSSLFNALLRMDRAIVTDVAGTTRDQLHERFLVGDLPVSLIDTAGLRQTDDTVESIGVERSRRVMADADLVIVMLDASEQTSDEDREILASVKDLDFLIALNKIDKVPSTDIDRIIAAENSSFRSLRDRIVPISAATLEGVEDLKAAIAAKFSTESGEAAGFVVSDARHHDLLRRSSAEVRDSLQQLEQNMSEEIVLIGLHNAIRFLGEITGETTTEDMLTRIFSTFCIGK